MANINGNYFNYSSNLFTSFRTSNTSSSSNLLGEYMSIQNGSYKKLLNAYYAKVDKKGSSSDSSDSTKYGNSKLSKTERVEYTTAKSDADALKASADELRAGGKNSLFQKVTKTVKDDKTGEEKKVTDYDRDAIAKAVKGFVEDYNKVVDSASEPDSLVMLRRTMQMTSLTKANSSQLSRVGIKIGSNNQLSVDEEKLKKADINTLKTLFQGSSSYVAQVSKKAADISKIAEQELTAAKTYSGRGGYVPTYTTGNLIDSFY